jgi:hypothetical protein
MTAADIGQALCERAMIPAGEADKRRANAAEACNLSPKVGCAHRARRLSSDQRRS